MARIRQVISQAYPARDWLLLDEFPLDAGRRRAGTPRIDVLAIQMSGRSDKPLARVAFEIKINRQDFADELRNPAKRRKAYNICDEYWFVVPENLVEKEEVPSECGLLWAIPGFVVPCMIKSARRLKPKPPSASFIMDLARRAYQVGLRDGAATCALERFDLVMQSSDMLIKNRATAGQRKEMVLRISRALREMQRHPEAKALAQIAAGKGCTAVWFVQRSLNSGGREQR